ncbi:hypothetical protein AOX59_12245 [Lentibacillus amyloliquefaciens]|uniref:Uncharacterized protein n=2 Tax=Lentibacillus amyloliquefaciens TaxID=1472767 RepID=A0A0U3NRL3_9BACI|nr:hypothetical protein AOX59_12245 [Lentibacillus amyloliquefaciens]
MSLTKPSLVKLVQKQFRFKLKNFSGMFSTLITLQLIGLLFSLGATSNFYSGGAIVDLEISYYSADIVFVFTILWGFISAVLMKTKAYREDDFAFVTNRLSSNLSNIAFLFSASIVGGVTAILSGYLLKVIAYFFFNFTPIIQTGLVDTPMELLTGMLSASLFIFLFASAGYLIGTLVHLHKSFAYITPVAVIGLLIIGDRGSSGHLLIEAGNFYFNETSFWLFACKILITAGLLLAGSFVVSQRLEVRT